MLLTAIVCHATTCTFCLTVLYLSVFSRVHSLMLFALVSFRLTTAGWR